jgi:hypothetical protein
MEQTLETPDYRMEILLGLKGFRIKQIDNIRACMGLVIDYDFLIDVTKNPAQWMVCFKDGADYRKVKLSDGVVPGIARTNAVTLIAAYQEAMVDRALDIEKPRRNGTYKPKDKPSAQPAPSPEPAQAQPSPAIGQAEEASEFKHKGRSDALNELIQSQTQPEEINWRKENPRHAEERDKFLQAQAQPSPDIDQAEEAKPEDASEIKHKGRSDALNELIQENKKREEFLEGLINKRAEPGFIIKATIGDGEPEPITFILNKMADRVQALEQAGPQEQIIRNISQDGITITKNAKGAYQWEIVARAADLSEAIDKALRADKRLRVELGQGGGPDA